MLEYPKVGKRRSVLPPQKVCNIIFYPQINQLRRQYHLTWLAADGVVSRKMNLSNRFRHFDPIEHVIFGDRRHYFLTPNIALLMASFHQQIIIHL